MARATRKRLRVEPLPAARDPVLDDLQLGLVQRQVLLDEDLTEAVLPTLRNLRIMSGVFVFSPVVARLMIKLFSREAFQSALAFMLMPCTMRLGGRYYYQQVLQR